MVLSVIAVTDRVLRDEGAQMGARRHQHVFGRHRTIPNLGLSNALRSSLVGWSKTMARGVAGAGVTANVVVGTNSAVVENIVGGDDRHAEDDHPPGKRGFATSGSEALARCARSSRVSSGRR